VTAYVKQPWTDDATAADAAHMNHIENGIYNAQATADSIPAGPQGTPGEKWFSGSGAPATGTGVVGDWYLNSTTGDFYEKTDTVTWTLRGNLKGPTGTTGPTGPTGATGPASTVPGPQGPTGPTGATGQAEGWYSGSGAPAGGTGVVGDWYLDTVAGDVYEKTGASAWTLRGNIRGPAGPTGSTGSTGQAEGWYSGVGAPAVGLGANGDWYLDTTSGAAGAAVPAYGTSLPASPVDGQEAILVGSVTNPSYQWRFRYNAGSSSAYKWEFIGGIPLLNEVAALDSIAFAAYTDAATVGPQLTVPRSGEYLIRFGAMMHGNGLAGRISSAAVKIGAAATNDNEAVQTGSGYNASVFREMIRACAASDVLKLQYKTSDGGAGQGSARFISVIPKRVS
jgi:hypothetical protein